MPSGFLKASDGSRIELVDKKAREQLQDKVTQSQMEEYVAEHGKEYDDTEVKQAIGYLQQEKVDYTQYNSDLGYANKILKENTEAIASINDDIGVIENSLENTATKNEIPKKTSDLTNDSDFTTKSYVDEEVAKGGKVKDVQINGTSIVNDGVANIPKAKINGASGNLGVVGVKSAGYSGGITIDDGGYIRLYGASDGQISSRSNAFYGFNTSQIDAIVKYAMGDGKGAIWNDTEKKNAQTRIGFDEDYALTEMLESGFIKVIEDDDILISEKGEIYVL